jgi:hypothetical protein
VENSGIDPTQATLARLAVDGLWFSAIHRYAPPDLQRRKDILEMILDMTFVSKGQVVEPSSD